MTSLCGSYLVTSCMDNTHKLWRISESCYHTASVSDKIPVTPTTPHINNCSTASGLVTFDGCDLSGTCSPILMQNDK